MDSVSLYILDSRFPSHFQFCSASWGDVIVISPSLEGKQASANPQCFLELFECMDEWINPLKPKQPSSRLTTNTFDLCYLLGVHPDVDASTDPEVEPAER